MENPVRSKIKGLLFTGCSGVCFACASLFVKLCGDIPVSLIILTRSLVQIIVSVSLNALLWNQSFNPKDKKTFLSLFGFLCFLTIYGIYMSFQTIPLGEATVIISTCPVFVALLERVILKTPISLNNVMSGLLCSVGVVILFHSNVTAPGVDTFYILGYVIITLATFAQAGSFILVRYVNVHYVIPVFYLGVSNTLLSSLIIIPQIPNLLHYHISLYQWLWLLLVSFFAVAGSFTLNIGLQYEQAAVVALVRNVDIVIAYICDVLLFHHSFSALSLVGSFIVITATVGSGVVNVLQETQQYKKLQCETEHSSSLIE